MTEHGEVWDTVPSAYALTSHCCASNLASVGKFPRPLRLVVTCKMVMITVLIMGVVLAF